jgi:dipeptidyl aminopeptidase/acylaminoacyl peptidase
VIFARNPQKNSEKSAGGIIRQFMNPTVPSPTPLPFAELTIPYLRAREYTSQLGKREVAYNGAGYTAYLTSYQSDGLRVNGLLTEPTGERPANGWPAIVFIHGYIPPSIYTTQGQYYDYVDYLARNGFVVFKIDLRGHAESEGFPGGAYYSSDYIVDALNARAALQSADFVNGNKIGLWGHSMAGNVVMRASAVRPEIPATVIWAGAVYTYFDMQEYGIQDTSYRPPTDRNLQTQRSNLRQKLFNTHGTIASGGAFWKQFAPTDYIKDLQGAVQIHHAVNDDVVNIEYSRGLKKLLDKTTLPHELIEYPSGGHNISGAAFNEAMQNTVVFFHKYLDN